MRSICALITIFTIFLFSASSMAIKKIAAKKTINAPAVANTSMKINSINPGALAAVLKAYECASHSKASKKFLTIIDYTKPSSEKRMYVIDMHKHQLVSQQLVAHGQNSGGKSSTKFSNRNGSHQSSIGVFVTENTYQGKNGLSLRLRGLDRGYNDRANQRAIVIHGANYVNSSYVKKHGMIGRSWGCPALEPKYAKSTIDTIKNGSVVVAYYKDKQWEKSSQYLHCAA